MSKVKALTARDVMSTRLVTLRPNQSLSEAVRVLVEASVSGAPVIDEGGTFCGLVSEYDCLRIMALGEYTSEDHEQNVDVADIMSRDPFTIAPDLDLFSLAAEFMTHGVRRFPVVEEGVLLGQVSRLDVLRGLWQLQKARLKTERPPTAPTGRSRGLYLSATDRAQEPLNARVEGKRTLDRPAGDR